ncbi:MAG: flagellar biosynthesis anti-sigma factor FlgM [Desulfovibrionaceae bacterium]|nr:flagellar biosynthesis anti-sigma factor FlgM [Desulfovibrionaceae bacterium]MDD4951235.1 flagellar biosynthesis anti-sigma factor FlgM [Desulfovibrionaceae bacterium]
MEIKNLIGELNPYAKRKIDETGKAPDKGAENARSGTEKANDVVSLSAEAKLRIAAHNAASEASDLRADKVRELKEKVRNDTYRPDIKKAAANLIRDDLDLLV